MLKSPVYDVFFIYLFFLLLFFLDTKFYAFILSDRDIDIMSLLLISNDGSYNVYRFYFIFKS